MFCSTQHNSCSANAVLDSRWIEQKFQSCGARDQNFLLKMKCVMNMYENWHNQIKQCHCFTGYTSALSSNNSELQFLGIYLPLKSDQVNGLMGALGFNLWSRDESDIWSSNTVYCKINIPNLLRSPPLGNDLGFLSWITSTGSTGHGLGYNKLQTGSKGTFQKRGGLKKRRKRATSSFPWVSALIFSLVHRWCINIT